MFIHLLNIVKEFKNLEKKGNLKHLHRNLTNKSINIFAILKTLPHRNELDEPSFAHEAAYSDSKDLFQRNISNTILKDRAYKIASNHKYYECQR